MQYIGVSGYARSGKNLFADIVKDILEKEYNKKVVIKALADKLKSNLNEFIKDVDFFTSDNKLKSKIRPMMIAYGNLMRDLSETTYWTGYLDKEIDKVKDQYDFVVIPDIRYNTCDKDECKWIQNKHKGKVIHIERFSYDNLPNILKKKGVSKTGTTKFYQEAPNDIELLNDPLVRRACDINVEWEYIDNADVNTEKLREVVRNTLKQLEII